MASNVVNVTQATFGEEVLQSTQPVLIDVWAAWCNPCRMLAPILEQVAGEQLGKLKVVKVNSDENMSLAMELGIMSLPTLILFKGGKEATRLVGLMSKPMIMSRLAPYL